MAQTETVQLSSSHVACVTKAVASIFSAIIGETPSLNQDEPMDGVLTWDGVVGVIALVGDVEWSLVICLSASTAPSLAERFAGFPIPFDSADMGDAIGELSNLLAGEVKVELDGIGVKTNISLPQVLRGKSIEILRLPHVPCKALLFDTSSGPFLVAIAAGQS